MPLTPGLVLGLLACGSQAPEPAPPEPVEVSTPTDGARIDAALDRALGWLDTYPGPVRFDAAVGIDAIWKIERSPGWKALRDDRIAALNDGDHEHHGFFDPTFRIGRDQREAWSIPHPGDRPVNPNRVLTEALYCADTGFRPEVEAYACGPMRDEGGLYTTHALWALDLARDRGCTEAPCIDELVQELVAAQPEPLAPERSLDVDLYAERLLMTCMVACPEEADRWAAVLLDHQRPDGSWGVADAQEDPYHRYHATMAAAWALALWRSNP